MMMARFIVEKDVFLGERPGSGDGEREASITRQMPFEPLPASVLFALVGHFGIAMMNGSGADE